MGKTQIREKDKTRRFRIIFVNSIAEFLDEFPSKRMKRRSLSSRDARSIDNIR